MEREILFRGKRADNGEWVEGWLVQDEYCGSEPPEIGKYSHGEFHGEYVVPETVEQFTGLYDAAGTRIFEGDILAEYDADEKRAEAVGFPISYLDAGFGVKYPGIELYHVLERRDCKHYAVIGNVHDNPELLINAAP